MRNRALMIVLSKVVLALVVAGAAGGAGCTYGPKGRVMADTPVLPYQAPDVDELSGADEEEDEGEADEGEAEPSAQNPQK